MVIFYSVSLPALGSPLALKDLDELEACVKRVNEILESKIEKEADFRYIFDKIRKLAKEVNAIECWRI